MEGYVLIHSADIYHHGVKGQKWGVRRWQNEDGSLTEAGREHYGVKARNASDKAEGWRTVEKVTKAQTSLATGMGAAGTAAQTAAVASMYGLSTGATVGLGLYGGVIGGLGAYAGMRLGRFMARKFAERQERKAQEYLEAIKDEPASKYMKSAPKEESKSENDKANKINEKLNRAKSQDKWDLNFMETIQNDYHLDEGDTQWMLKEYKKYLNDPEKYMTTFEPKYG